MQVVSLIIQLVETRENQKLWEFHRRIVARVLDVEVYDRVHSFAMV